MKKAGFIAIVGRPNVGKSTLMNKLLGQKISITSRKPQTTRHQILGVKTTPDTQLVFVDTPGMHKRTPKAMNKYMNKAARDALLDVDVVCFVVGGTHWTEEDQLVLDKLQDVKAPVLLVVNKIDQVKNKKDLLPFIENLSKQCNFVQVLPVSAKNNEGLSDLEAIVTNLLPESEFFFPDEQITDKSDRFMAAELIREKLMRSLGQELPYAVTVEINQFKESEKLIQLDATIWVEKKGHKGIVIGKQGEKLKRVGSEARQDMERFFQKKVFLELWVKVKEGWSDDIRALRSLGYQDK
jgi:GTP-binding protein Era